MSYFVRKVQREEIKRFREWRSQAMIHTAKFLIVLTKAGRFLSSRISVLDKETEGV